MRIENVFCEDCGKVHFVQIVQRNRKGEIVKTKCLGADFLPIMSNPAIGEGKYIRHKMRGYNIVQKIKSQPKGKIVMTFKKPYTPPQPVISVNRICVAEMSMNFYGKFTTIKVFDDATPDKFYEVFYEVGGKPAMIKTRSLGKGKPVHISDIARIFNVQGKTNLVFYSREKYEKLFAVDPESNATILETNARVVSSLPW